MYRKQLNITDKRKIDVSSEIKKRYYILLLITVCAVYYNALECGFVFDDISAVRDNKDIRPITPLSNIFWNDFWGTPIIKEHSHKSYRPLCVLTFRINYLLHELNPIGYHLVNILLHALVCILYLRLCYMFLSRESSLMATMLFAVHPIHTEAVTGVVGRAEILSSVFFLLAFLCYIQSSQWNGTETVKSFTAQPHSLLLTILVIFCIGIINPALRDFFLHRFLEIRFIDFPIYGVVTDWQLLMNSAFLVTLATLSKEQGITVVGVCIVYEIFVLHRDRLRDMLYVGQYLGKPLLPNWLREMFLRISVLVFVSVMLLIVRVRLMGSQLPVFTKFDNPAAVADTPTRQLTYNYLLSVNAWLLLFPCDLCCDWTMGTIPLLESFLDPRNFTTVILYLSLFLLIWKGVVCEGGNHNTVVLISLALMGFSFLPASNLFFPVGFVVAERVLYTPSMGMCLLVAYGWQRLYKRR